MVQSHQICFYWNCPSEKWKMLATYFVDPPFFCIDPHQWKIWYLVMEVQFSLKKMCLQGESIRIRRYVQTTMIVGMPKRKKKREHDRQTEIPKQSTEKKATLSHWITLV